MRYADDLSDPTLWTEPRPRDADEIEFEDYTEVALRQLRKANAWWRLWSTGWLTTKDCLCPGWVLRELAEDGAIEFRKLADNVPNEWRIIP